MTTFELMYHTNKYDSVITAVETLSPDEAMRDASVLMIISQIKMLEKMLLDYCLNTHCEDDM